VGIYETVSWLNSKGIENAAPMNKGGTIALAGSSTITVTMVHADHSCGITGDDGELIYGGEAVGYVIKFENGYCIYHAGDTAVFGDMALIAELYSPDLCVLPIGDRFVMSPREAAKACKLLGAKMVVPMHFGTFPLLTGTPQEFARLVADQGVEVPTLKPGEALT
jgi:L-ascorbate metabolism protein UlaG (beta-lactamase superfamily)